MTPEHTALVADLKHAAENSGMMDAGIWPVLCTQSAAAIRALSGENQDLRDGTGMTKLAAQRNEAFEERDTLRAEVERLKGRLAQADEWLAHDPSCAWPHNEDWESKGRVCSCGLAEFLNEVPGGSMSDKIIGDGTTVADIVAERDRLAGEVEQLEEELETAEAVHDGVALERDTLRAGFLGNPPKYVMWHEFESMRAEVERLTKDRDDFSKASATNWESFKRVRAEVAALRKDAERLEYLCRNMPGRAGRILLGELADTADMTAWRARIDAALADKPRYTDGRGNDISHLVDP